MVCSNERFYIANCGISKWMNTLFWSVLYESSSMFVQKQCSFFQLNLFLLTLECKRNQSVILAYFDISNFYKQLLGIAFILFLIIIDFTMLWRTFCLNFKTLNKHTLQNYDSVLKWCFLFKICMFVTENILSLIIWR